MAAFTKTATAVIKVKADTATANKGLGKTTKALATMAAGIFAAKKAFDALSAAGKEYAKRAQLTAAVTGASFKEIQGAAKGLLTETQSLEFAAAAMNGAFRLSQDDMNNAAKAMVALRNQGNDFERVVERVTKAIVEGNGRALREFGVNVDGSTGKLGTFNNVMKELNALADSQSFKMDVAGDSMLRAGVKYQDAVDKFNLALGRLAALLGPILNDLIDFGELVGGSVADAIRGDGIGARGIGQAVSGAFAGTELSAEAIKARQAPIFSAAEEQALALAQRGTPGGADIRARGFAEVNRLRKARSSGNVGKSKVVGSLSAAGVGGGGLGPLTVGFGGSLFLPGDGPREDVGSFGAGAIEGAAAGLPGLTGGESGAFAKDFEARAQKMRDQMQSIVPIANAFASAGASAFNAWISGSISAGEAIRKFIGGALRSIASQMAVEAIKHGAMAIGSLAFGDAKGASLHGKAAAAHAAGAIAAGVAAKTVLGSGGAGGGGGARASGGLPGGGGSVGGGAGAPGGGSSTTVIVASHPLEHNPREATRKVRRALGTAESHGAGTRTVTS